MSTCYLTGFVVKAWDTDLTLLELSDRWRRQVSKCRNPTWDDGYKGESEIESEIESDEGEIFQGVSVLHCAPLTEGRRRNMDE